MSSLPRLLPAVAAALLAAVSVPQLHAQTKTLGSGKPTGPLILSRSELRECLSKQSSLKAKRDEAEQTKENLSKEKDELKRLGDELKEKLSTLDRSSQEQVDQYNAQASERDKRIDAYEARTASFNQQVEQLNAERAAWGKNCENKRYDEKDEMAIKAGK
jgi:hypothetical protein